MAGERPRRSASGALTSMPEMVAEAGAPQRRLKICLAGSGGGHIRQLLDLEPVWSRHDSFFVTEDLALGATVSTQHRTYFLPHFAFGQLKLGGPLRPLWNAAVSFVKSAGIILKERPDVLISEGAGAMYFAVLWARLTGACVIILESFARFEAPSLFGRLAAPLAHHIIAYAEPLRAYYPKAVIFDPIRVLDDAAPAKKDLVFATVGATLPFDRLVEMVAEAKRSGAIPEQLKLQVGTGGVAPTGLDVVETLPFDEVQRVLDDASIVICHGGTGSLITAMSKGCHVIAVPRLAALGEHYDDHQAEITHAFAKRGLIQVANNADELRVALAETKRRARIVATSDPGDIIAFIDSTLNRDASARKRPA